MVVAFRAADALSNGTMAEVKDQRLMAEVALVEKYKGLLLVLALGYGIICVLSVLLVVYMRRNRTGALRGDTSAARKMILPAYLPLLLVLMIVSFGYTVYFWILRFFVDAQRISSKLETEIYYSGRLYFILLIIVYMYQKSVSGPALRRAAVIALALATYNIPVVLITDKYCSTELAYWIPQFSRVALVVFYLWVFVLPPARASKRTLREYCVFVFVYYALYFAYTELFHQQKLDAGFLMVYANIFWGSLCPLVIWRVLVADTEHWRGLGRRAVALQSLFRQKHCMNERISSRGLHVLIEMHRKFIIDFAYLELKRKIGTGSSAVVFNGVLNSKTPVAVKVYSPTELTDEIVAEFSHEAALCGALHHPNIVTFYGMCVCPPTICLVSELCQGSLDDVTQAIARRAFDVTRQQLLIDLNYMIDATRAVAYLHSFAPAFLHRDIKPANFLVDRHAVVKLTDFGESRSLPRECGGGHASSSHVGTSSGAGGASARGLRASGVRLSHDTWPSLLGGASADVAAPPPRGAMTVRGTAEYMAPELIQGKAGTALYGEAADIFSLAMTLWDIAHPLGDKYPAANGNHLKVFEAVLSGTRPPLSASFHPGLRDVLRSAWDPRPEQRPSALCVLTALEKIQQEVSGDVAMMLSNALEKKIVISKKGCTTEPTVSGQALVQKMLEFDAVGSVEEAVRAGNGFMSAGLLHHARHMLGFENSPELFMFDDSLLEMLQHPDERLYLPPIVERVVSSVARSSRSSSSERDEHDTDSSSMPDQLANGSSGSHGTANGTTMAPAQGIVGSVMQATGELLHIGPRRKYSRVTDEDARRMSVSSSQWANTTTMDTGACSCRKLGAGMLLISKSAAQRRFRRVKKAAAVQQAGSCQVGSSVGASMTSGASVSTGGTFSKGNGGGLRAAAPTDDRALGLTAELLLNEFTHTGESAYDAYDSPTHSAGDVDMVVQLHGASDDEDDYDDVNSLNSSGVKAVDAV